MLQIFGERNYIIAIKWLFVTSDGKRNGVMLILIIYNAQEIFDYFINKFCIILIFDFLKCYTYVLPCYVSETFAVSCIYYGYKLYEHYNCIVLLIQLAFNKTRSFDETN